MLYDGLSSAEIYERALVSGVFQEWTPAIVEAAGIADGERVLDLACGTGAVTRLIAQAVGRTGSVLGVDVNPAMLDVARQRQPSGDGPAVEWHQASADDLPVADDDVDVVVCQQGFQFFPDRAGAAAEVARVLRPGGRVVLSVWCGLAANPVQGALNESLIREVGAPIFALPFSFGSASDVEELLATAGFAEVATEEEARTAHFTSVAQFVEASILGVAAIVPAIGDLSDEQRHRLVDRSVEDLAGPADRYTSEDGFRFPMTSLVARGRKP